MSPITYLLDSISSLLNTVDGNVPRTADGMYLPIQGNGPPLPPLLERMK